MIRFRDLLRRLVSGRAVGTDRERDLAETVHDRPILIAIGWAWYAYRTAETAEGRHEAERHIELWEGMAGPFTLSELIAAWETSAGLWAALESMANAQDVNNLSTEFPHPAQIGNAPARPRSSTAMTDSLSHDG